MSYTDIGTLPVLAYPDHSSDRCFLPYEKSPRPTSMVKTFLIVFQHPQSSLFQHLFHPENALETVPSANGTPIFHPVPA